jgi:hypothetical protein
MIFTVAVEYRLKFALFGTTIPIRFFSEASGTMQGMGGRVVECARLESVFTER